MGYEDAITRLKRKMYPVIAEVYGEEELLVTPLNEDGAMRRQAELYDELVRHGDYVEFDVNGLVYSVIGRLVYPEGHEDFNALFDWVLGREKAVILSLDDYWPRVYAARIGGERGFLLRPGHSVYFVKPDFLDQEGRRAFAWRHGEVRWVVDVETGHGRKLFEVARLSVAWVRHAQYCKELARLRRWSYRDLRECVSQLHKLGDNRDVAALLYIESKTRRGTRYVTRREFRPAFFSILHQNPKTSIEFGNQRFKIKRVEEVEREVERRWWSLMRRKTTTWYDFNHKIVGWVKRRRGSTIVQTRFDVWRVRRRGDYIRYVIEPQNTGRIVVESHDHDIEGLGRGLVRLYQGDVLIFEHRRPVDVENVGFYVDALLGEERVHFLVEPRHNKNF